MKNRIIWLTLVAILAPVIVFGFLGCMKKPDHTPDYGPEVTFAQIQEAWENDMPPETLTMRKGQYVSIDVVQVIDHQAPVLLSQRLDEITDRADVVGGPSQDQTLAVSWDFSVVRNDLQADNTWKQSKDYPRLELDLSEADVQSFAAKATGTPAKGIYTLSGLRTLDNETPLKITYHNLKREDGFMPVPVDVKNQADGDCGGLANCDRGLRYMQISFDRVVWDRPDKGIKTTYKISYSADIPTYIFDWSNPDDIYPTNQLQFCAQTWLELESGSQTQIIPVLQCANMRDFQHGKCTQPEAEIADPRTCKLKPK